MQHRDALVTPLLPPACHRENASGPRRPARWFPGRQTGPAVPRRDVLAGWLAGRHQADAKWAAGTAIHPEHGAVGEGFYSIYLTFMIVLAWPFS